MKKNISIHQVGINNSPIRKLKLHSSIKKFSQNSTQPDKCNPAHQKIFKIPLTNLADQSIRGYQDNQFSPHLQKVNIQFYQSNQTIMPYAYTTNQIKNIDSTTIHQKKYLKANIKLQKKIKSLNQACLAQSVSSDQFSNQNPQTQFQSESEYNGQYSPFQPKGRPFTYSFQPKKQINYQKMNCQRQQTAKFTDLMCHKSQNEDLMQLSINNYNQKVSKCSLASSLINFSRLNQYKEKNISESLVVFDYNRALQENQFRVSNLQNSQLESRQAQINKDLINYFKNQKLKKNEMQQNNKIATCKTSQITQPNSIISQNQGNKEKKQFFDLKIKKSFEKYIQSNIQKNENKIRIETLQNQTRQNCFYDNSIVRKQYNSAESKFRKLRSKNSLQKQLKSQSSKQKIKKQVKLSLTKNLIFQKNPKQNKLKLRDRQQQTINKIQYKKTYMSQKTQNHTKYSCDLQKQDQSDNKLTLQRTNFSQLKSVKDLKKIQKKFSNNQQF